LPGAQILTWIGAKIFQAGRIAEKVLLPFVHITADRILAAYLHAAHGVDDSSTRRGLLIWTLADTTPVISLIAHLNAVSEPLP
jgi:hypothetical protein